MTKNGGHTAWAHWPAVMKGMHGIIRLHASASTAGVSFAISNDRQYVRQSLTLTVGDLTFSAQLEEEAAPVTAAALLSLLPITQPLIQARWSGEAAWVPLGSLDLGLVPENATSYPSPGEVLLYPGGFSETEILLPYGRTNFASTMGQLAGNHVLTIIEGREQLTELGRRVVWEGAQQLTMSR